ncbi:hypothetical protein [Bradyrhizobium genosp. A]|uniref:GAP1-N1 domain-containing protein n=1 Tax=Bradyrhizobium genosp. A TaxID=83626 RepID=UPI003CF0AE22
MTDVRIDQQEHGYRNGHQLLGASLRLPSEDQDTVDRLSDMAGSVRPGEVFEPYLTGYPLLSGTHYVLARTWQDREAPRAGCVLTRSLLVPMSYWESFANISQLTALLVPVDRDTKLASTSPADVRGILPKVEDARTVELVEALFLEKRQPIVFFETPEAEAIFTRLLSALWPGLRRNFAGCTFSLAPRKIEGRLFDLLFVPKSARSRFNDWTGRRIDVSSPGSPRHRWSNATAQQIFQSDNPRLVDRDVLGTLREDDRGDESALRLSLLWNELVAKAASTPSAVLGLLDILNATPGGTVQSVASLHPLLKNSIELAAEKLSTDEAWLFFSALLTKMSDKNAIPDEIATVLHHRAVGLARKLPGKALDFFESASYGPRDLPPQLIGAIGDGLDGQELDQADRLELLPAELLTALAARSVLFSRSVFALTKNLGPSWIHKLQGLLASADPALRRALRPIAGSYFIDAALTPLIRPLLDGASDAELTKFAVDVGRACRFAIPEFDQPITDAARDEGSLNALRNAVYACDSGPGSDRFLLSSLRLDVADVVWFHDLQDEERASRLFVALISAASERQVFAAQRDALTRDRMLALLSRNLQNGALGIARILRLGEVDRDRALDLGREILPNLPADASIDLLDNLLARALADAPPHDARVPFFLEEAVGKIGTRHLIHLATDNRASPSRIAQNVALIEGGSETLRSTISYHIDILSERLAYRCGENLGEPAYDAWARLIEQCSSSEAKFKACSTALSFALKSPLLPVSSLIVASFPTIYAELLRSKEGDQYTIPAFVLLPLSFFVDWDRARSAQRDLIETFVRSNWPPHRLLLASLDAGIADSTLDQLRRTGRGRAYIREMDAELPRLSANERHRMHIALSEFRS